MAYINLGKNPVLKICVVLIIININLVAMLFIISIIESISKSPQISYHNTILSQNIYRIVI